MPTNAHATSRFATMTAAEVLREQTRLVAQWELEDAARRARNAAILASL